MSGNDEAQDIRRTFVLPRRTVALPEKGRELFGPLFRKQGMNSKHGKFSPRTAGSRQPVILGGRRAIRTVSFRLGCRCFKTRVFQVAGTEWCSCTIIQRPSTFRSPTVNRKSRGVRRTFSVGSTHYICAKANATSSPATTSSHLISNATGSGWRNKTTSNCLRRRRVLATRTGAAHQTFEYPANGSQEPLTYSLHGRRWPIAQANPLPRFRSSGTSRLTLPYRRRIRVRNGPMDC